MKSIQKNSLSQRLKNVATNIHVDVFGYEKQVEHNILSYFKVLSKKTSIPTQRIIVRIFKDQGNIRSCMYQKGKCIYDIPLTELIFLFTGVPTSQLESKITTTIKSILFDLAKTYHLDHNAFQICIVSRNDKAIVMGVSKTEVVGEIPIKTLIPYFI